MDFRRCKLFVGGISRNTTDEDLRVHFDHYGEVSLSTVIKNRHNQNPRGFGFVTFSDPSAADAALAQQHVILGKTVDVKIAIPRSESHQLNGNVAVGENINGFNGQGFTSKKIFVGGLAHDLSEEELKNYFVQFGKITDAVVMHDNTKQRPRGFGFVTFESEESVEDAMQNNFHLLKGKRVEVKRAVQKNVMDSIIGAEDGELQRDYPPFNPLYAGPVPVHPCGPYGLIPYGCWYPVGGFVGGSWYGPNCYPVAYDASGNYTPFCSYPAATHVNGVPPMNIRGPGSNRVHAGNGHMEHEVEEPETETEAESEVEEHETEAIKQVFDSCKLNQSKVVILDDRAK